ncbi:MAG: PBS lyase [Desulfobacterales bacterium]|nr:MAG: PBS lyase [Desulfobacterales bacterium]
MGKQTVKTSPWCPFCGSKVAKASDAPRRKMNEFPVGRCLCGAVYTCDVTGHNVGSAMVETLVYACEDNWDLAWELMPEDDYLTGRIENYDEPTHQVVDKGNLDGRPVRGVLYFVRLHTEISELAKRLGEKKKKEIAAEVAAQGKVVEEVTVPARKEGVKRKANKRLVMQMAESHDIEGLVLLCLADKKTLRLLQRRLYDPVEDNRWRTAWLIGQVCSRVAAKDPGPVSELLHRMFEACSDSAAANWGMVECIGTIIAGRPDIFGAFTRHLLNYVDDESTRVQSLWGLAEIGEKRPDLIREIPFFMLFRFLQHSDAAVRGLMVRLLGVMRAREASGQLMALSMDSSPFEIWKDGEKYATTVGEQVAVALKTIQGVKENDAAGAKT